MLALLVKTLAAGEKYLLLHRGNLFIPIQIQLSIKQKKISCFFAIFLKSSLNFEYSEKKMTLTGLVFPKLQTPKKWLDKCLKSPVSEDTSTSSIKNVPKHC